MSVPSKALRVTVIAGLLIGLSSCASQYSPTDPALQNNATGGTDVYGDSAAADSAVSAADNQTAAAPVTEVKKLLEMRSSNLGMDLERSNSFSRISLNTGTNNGMGEPVVDVQALSNPDRLVVDLLGNTKVKPGTVQLSSDPYVSSVRIGSHADRTRVVFDLQDGQSVHSVDTVGGVVQVTFNRPGTTVPASEPDTGMIAKQETAPKAEQAIVETAAVEEPVKAIESEKPPVRMAKPADSMADRTVAKVEETPATLDKVAFQRGWNDSGTVELDLSDAIAFDLSRSTATEYVLQLPGVTASEVTRYPTISPKGFPGIRSARAVQNASGTTVRMFVDSGVNLKAIPRGNQIVVQANAALPAKDPKSRAQAKLVEVEELPAGSDTLPPEAANPPAGADAGDKKDETASNDNVDLSDPNTARKNPTGIRSADGSKIYTGRLISLDLQDTDIDNALRIIAEVSNLNIIASDDVTGKVTLRLIDVPWDQALDVILKTNGLDQVTEGNVIRIAPIDKLRQEREALREAKRAQEQLEDLTVQYIRVSYARVDELQEQVESVLSERGTVAVDERTNQLIVKDIKKGHDDALELIKRLDLRTPQVLLETQIVEGQRNILRDLGFQWNFTYIQSPGTGNATGYNFPNSITVGGGVTVPNQPAAAVSFPAAVTGERGGSAIAAVFDSADGSRSLSAIISALESEGFAKVISRPQVATVNNKQAEIRSVETVRIRVPGSGTSIATGAGAQAAGGGASAFEEIDVGIELRVTPQASPDYYVLLDVEAKSSAFGGRQVDGIPSTIEREATSTILVKSGQTFALGGVYRINDTESINGVPWLKDIPFLGTFFRRTRIDKTDEELIFFITPHIVEGSFDPSLM